MEWSKVTVACLFLLAHATCGAQELSLHRAIEQALRAPQAQAAAAQTDMVRGQLRQAGLGLNPRLYLQAEDWRPWGSDFDYGSQTENYVFLSQTLELDGKRQKRVAVGQAQLAQAEAQEEAMRLQIAGRVAAAYWNAAVLQETVTLLQRDMQAVDAMVRYHQERVAAGAMRGVDLLRMQIERDRLEMALRTTERDAAEARLELFKQMGQPASTEVVLSDPLEAPVPVELQPAATVLARRADLQAARQQVAVAQADVKLQKANGVPDPDLVGGFKRNNANNTGYASLQIPLPFRNRNQGEIERAEAGVHVAQDRLAALEAQVRVELTQSEQNYRQEQTIVHDLLPDMRSKAQENLRLMTEAYQIGGVDLLRFLDAERTAFEVEVSALRTLADHQQAALRLQLSYGIQP